MQMLASHQQCCAVGFEPIDNISLGFPADHRARLRWLELLWQPKRDDDVTWTRWKKDIEQASVFGQIGQIHSSLSGCRRDMRAVGLKARLSRLLSDSDATQHLQSLVWRQHVRILRLSRENGVKQTLAEYNRRHAGLGQFAAADGRASATEVKLDVFAQALRDVARSRQLTDRITALLSSDASPVLHIRYEDLLRNRSSTMSRIGSFLGLAADFGGDGSGGGGGYRKATPDRMCTAIANYAELCRAFVGTHHAADFDEPCDSRCAGAVS